MGHIKQYNRLFGINTSVTCFKKKTKNKQKKKSQAKFTRNDSYAERTIISHGGEKRNPILSDAQTFKYAYLALASLFSPASWTLTEAR